MLRFSLALTMTAGCLRAAAAQGLPAPSDWVNPRGSVLVIESVGAGGKIAGTFTNKAAGYRCHDTFALATGKVEGDSLSFVVNFKNAAMDCQSLVAWQGHVEGNTLETHWKLAHADADGSLKIMDGSDRFTRQ
jgi:hypothetical protein